MQALDWQPIDDGSNGRFRADKAKCLLVMQGIDTDQDSIDWWLSGYRDSQPATYRSYKKEIARFYLWATQVARMPLSSLTNIEMHQYEKFMRNPPPEWCSPNIGKIRKPFAGPLSESSRYHAMVVIVSYFNKMVQTGYLAYSPMNNYGKRFSRDIEKNRRKSKRRAPSDKQWACLINYLDTQQKVNDCIETRRARFAIAMLYFCHLRVSELAQHRMNSFVCEPDENGVHRWWFLLDGQHTKTGKSATLPVPPELMEQLQAYRLYRGLNPLPDENDDAPLIQDLRQDKHNLGVGVRCIHGIIKDAVRAASDALDSDEEAAEMQRISTHWFRRSGLTLLEKNGMSLSRLKKQSRHASTTTLVNSYLSPEDGERHQEVSAKLTWRR